MAPRLSGKRCKFSKFLLSLNSQKRLEYKENITKYKSLSRKPRRHVRILIYRTWPIANERLLIINDKLACSQGRAREGRRGDRRFYCNISLRWPNTVLARAFADAI